MQVVFYLLMISARYDAPDSQLSLHDTPLSCEVAKKQVEELSGRYSNHRYICVQGVK